MGSRAWDALRPDDLRAHTPAWWARWSRDEVHSAGAGTGAGAAEAVSMEGGARDRS